MKTVLEYLEEQKDMACHNLLCYSKTYGMDTPKEGMEQAFAEAKREVEIVEELVVLAQKNVYPKLNERHEIMHKVRITRNGLVFMLNGIKLKYFDNELLMWCGYEVLVKINPQNLNIVKIPMMPDGSSLVVELNVDIMIAQGASKDDLRSVMLEIRQNRKKNNKISKYGHMDSLDILCGTTDKTKKLSRYNDVNMLDLYCRCAKLNSK